MKNIAQRLLSNDEKLQMIDSSDLDQSLLFMLTKSSLEIQALQALEGPKTGIIFVNRTLTGLTRKARELEGPALDWNGDAADEKALEDLNALKARFQNWVPSNHQISESVSCLPLGPP